MKIREIIRRTIRRVLKIEDRHPVPHCCIISKDAVINAGARIWNSSQNPENIVIGAHSCIAGVLLVWRNCGSIKIGEYTFVGENTRVYSAKNISIGNRVQIAHGCNIFDSNVHSMNPEERHLEYMQNMTGGLVKLFSLAEKEVVINDDAWLGANVIVLKGVTIGKGAIVGAGSVVVSDVPDKCVFAGNPARLVRRME